MPKLKNLLIAVAAAMLSTSAALTDTKADDRSYLPPQDLQAQAKDPVYRPRRKPSPAFATRIMGRRLATRAAITLRGTPAAISFLAFSSACSVSLDFARKAAAVLFSAGVLPFLSFISLFICCGFTGAGETVSGFFRLRYHRQGLNFRRILFRIIIEKRFDSAPRLGIAAACQRFERYDVVAALQVLL